MAPQREETHRVRYSRKEKVQFAALGWFAVEVLDWSSLHPYDLQLAVIPALAGVRARRCA